MSNFNVDKKETYSYEKLQEHLKQNKNVVYAQANDDIQKTYQDKLEKLKEYETKVNQYEEKRIC